MAEAFGPPEQVDGTAPVQPPDILDPDAHVISEDVVTQRAGWVRRVLGVLGIDRAIGFTVLARGWSSIAGLGTLALIARFLSPAEQGFYYTFYSLVALQIVFELGFSVVILQTASHEAAHLTIEPDGTVSGPEREHARLASVLQKSVRWYTLAALLMAVVLLPVGMHFFRANAVRFADTRIHWGLPWALVVIASAFTFQIDPLFSFLEGCGYVPQIARTRLQQAVLGTLMGWGALLAHHGLFAPGLMIGGQAIAGGRFVYSKRGLLLPLLRRATGEARIRWGAEVWPFQWRIAVSWLCGYFTFQLFNPMLFRYRGPVEAGQMGMTMNVCGTLSSMAIAWMNTKAAPFGQMIARRQFRELDRTFFRALVQSTTAAVVVSTVVWIATWYLTVRGHGIVHRLLPLDALALVLTATIGNIVVFAEALYLRAHKQEKFMLNSILGALWIAPTALLMARAHGAHAGAWGIAATYLAGTAVIGLGYGTYTFLHWRRVWHSESLEG